MQRSAAGPGTTRDIAILCAAAVACGATAWAGLPAALTGALGAAALVWAIYLIRRRHIATERLERAPVSITPQFSDLHRVAETSDDLLLVFAPSGPIASANNAAGEFFGAGGIGLVGRSIEDLLPQPEIVEIYESARSGQRRECEVAITGRDSRRVFRVLGAPIAGNGGNRVMLRLRDVTDFQSALRLGGDFVASVSHELRTPLASIKAALETLETSVHDDPAMTHKLLEMIGTNADRLEALTADVLRLSQLESSGQAPELSDVDVQPSLESIGVLLDPLFSERELRLEIDVSPQIATIATDPRLFELIFKNLLENAGKFAFENTAIRIVGRPGPLPSTSIWKVIDKGVGIPIHHQTRIFDRFYQVDGARAGTSKRRGTGLGLAIVQNAVRALGGTIRVDSVWQQGTTMIVELPIGSVVTPPSRPSFPEVASS